MPEKFGNNNIEQPELDQASKDLLVKKFNEDPISESLKLALELAKKNPEATLDFVFQLYKNYTVSAEFFSDVLWNINKNHSEIVYRAMDKLFDQGDMPMLASIVEFLAREHAPMRLHHLQAAYDYIADDIARGKSEDWENGVESLKLLGSLLKQSDLSAPEIKSAPEAPKPESRKVYKLEDVVAQEAIVELINSEYFKALKNDRAREDALVNLILRKRISQNIHFLGDGKWGQDQAKEILRSLDNYKVVDTRRAQPVQAPTPAVEKPPLSPHNKILSQAEIDMLLSTVAKGAKSIVPESTLDVEVGPAVTPSEIPAPLSESDKSALAQELATGQRIVVKAGGDKDNVTKITHPEGRVFLSDEEKMPLAEDLAVNKDKINNIIIRVEILDKRLTDCLNSGFLSAKEKETLEMLKELLKKKAALPSELLSSHFKEKKIKKVQNADYPAGVYPFEQESEEEEILRQSLSNFFNGLEIIEEEIGKIEKNVQEKEVVGQYFSAIPPHLAGHRETPDQFNQALADLEQALGDFDAFAALPKKTARELVNNITRAIPEAVDIERIKALNERITSLRKQNEKEIPALRKEDKMEISWAEHEIEALQGKIDSIKAKDEGEEYEGMEAFLEKDAIEVSRAKDKIKALQAEIDSIKTLHGEGGDKLNRNIDYLQVLQETFSKTLNLRQLREWLKVESLLNIETLLAEFEVLRKTLPDDRQEALTTIRQAIIDHLDRLFKHAEGQGLATTGSKDDRIQAEIGALLNLKIDQLQPLEQQSLGSLEQNYLDNYQQVEALVDSLSDSDIENLPQPVAAKIRPLLLTADGLAEMRSDFLQADQPEAEGFDLVRVADLSNTISKRLDSLEKIQRFLTIFKDFKEKKQQADNFFREINTLLGNSNLTSKESKKLHFFRNQYQSDLTSVAERFDSLVAGIDLTQDGQLDNLQEVLEDLAKIRERLELLLDFFGVVNEFEENGQKLNRSLDEIKALAGESTEEMGRKFNILTGNYNKALSKLRVDFERVFKGEVESQTLSKDNLKNYCAQAINMAKVVTNRLENIKNVREKSVSEVATGFSKEELGYIEIPREDIVTDFKSISSDLEAERKRRLDIEKQNKKSTLIEEYESKGNKLTEQYGSKKSSAKTDEDRERLDKELQEKLQELEAEKQKKLEELDREFEKKLQKTETEIKVLYSGNWVTDLYHDFKSRLEFETDKDQQIINRLYSALRSILKNKGLVKFIDEEDPDDKLSKEGITAMAEEVCQTIHASLRAGAEELALKETADQEIRQIFKKGLSWAAKLRSVPEFAGSAWAFSSLGGIGSAVAGGAFLIGSKIFGKAVEEKLEDRRVKKAVAEEKKQRWHLNDLTLQKANDFFSADDAASNLATAMSNTIGRVTKEPLVERGKDKMTILEDTRSDIYKQLSRHVDFKNLSERQINQAADLIALTLTQEECGRAEAETAMSELEKKNPRAYQTIMDFKVGKHPQKPHQPLTMEDFWVRARSDIASLTLGAAIGLSVNVSPWFAIAGIPSAIKIVKDVPKIISKGADTIREKPVIKEMTARAERVRQIINDYRKNNTIYLSDETPAHRIKFVQEQLALGLLDREPLLKEQATEFIRRAREVIFNERGLDAISNLTSKARFKESLGEIIKKKKEVKKKKVKKVPKLRVGHSIIEDE